MPTTKAWRIWRECSSTARGSPIRSAPTSFNIRPRPANYAANLRRQATAIDAAIAARKRAGDILGLGNALRISARIRWLCGESQVAESQSAEALKVLADYPESWEYAMALSAQSQLEGSLTEARRRPRVRDVLWHWQNAWVATTSTFMHGPIWRLRAQRTMLKRGLGVSSPQSLRHGCEASLICCPGIYGNLTYMMTYDRRFQDLFTYLEEGIAAAVARDNAPLEAYIRGARALALLDLGRDSGGGG